MIRVFPLVIAFAVSYVLTAQNLDLIKNRTFVYEAFFIETNGDTITREEIHFTFTDNPWKFHPEDQKDLRIYYFTDSTGINGFRHPFEKRRKEHARYQKKKEKKKKGWENWTWIFKAEETGYILNDSIFWIHPPRNNQYLYNEISGMPHIELNKLFKDSKWKSKLIIMIGWHEFKGSLESTYIVNQQINYIRGDINVSNAWEINVLNSHSTLGNYQSKILFDENQYGFLMFDNSFYDGKRIVLNLINEKTTRQQALP